MEGGGSDFLLKRGVSVKVKGISSTGGENAVGASSGRWNVFQGMAG